MPVFYYFLKRTFDGEMREAPYVSDHYMGEIGDFCLIDNINYVIVDYVVENV